MARPSLKERAAERPPWLKVRVPPAGAMEDVTAMMRQLRLTTVCEEARCPNIFECWSQRTATFMLMGEVCTRRCGFCAVSKGKPAPLDPGEPQRVAEAVERLGLSHAVLTSVNRDDLPDGGAGHFVAAIEAVRERNPHCSVEVLIPDFQGDFRALDTVLAAAPEVLNHNLETVPRLTKRARNGAQFERSLEILRRASRLRPPGLKRTKSGLMVGLGERTDELLETFARLREAQVEVLTLGQYLQPSSKQLPVERWVSPAEFEELGEKARAMGFAHVESGVFVRSSYHARRQLEAGDRDGNAGG